MPDNAARYLGSKVARYRRWVRRLTLKQYALFAGVFHLVTATAAKAVTSAVMTKPPFSWFFVAAWTVVMTAFYTWMRSETLRQDKEHPAGQEDGANCHQ